MKPEMTSGALVNLVELFERAGIEVWLDGGWAVDAVLGEQTVLRGSHRVCLDSRSGILREKSLVSFG